MAAVVVSLRAGQYLSPRRWHWCSLVLGWRWEWTRGERVWFGGLSSLSSSPQPSCSHPRAPNECLWGDFAVLRRRAVGGLVAVGLVDTGGAQETLHHGFNSRSLARRVRDLLQGWCSSLLGKAALKVVLEMQAKGFLSTFVCFYLEIRFPGSPCWSSWGASQRKQTRALVCMHVLGSLESTLPSLNGWECFRVCSVVSFGLGGRWY